LQRPYAALVGDIATALDRLDARCDDGRAAASGTRA
jgi:hypothetical protein